MMPSIIRTLLPGIALFALVLQGCTTDGDKELRYWEEHTQAATRYEADWPGFGRVLNGIIKRVEPSWRQALTMTDEDARTARMKEINKAVNRLSGKLGEVAKKIDKIKGEMRELQELELDDKRVAMRAEGLRHARKALTEVDQVLSTAKPDNELAASAGLEPVIARLIGAITELERTRDRILRGK